ncbi:MAG: response regulator [Chloroflexota bacterium]
MKHAVLLVDDEDTIRTMLRMVLELTGFKVLEAADGIQAIEQVETHQPDIMVLDVMMPRMDGFAVCRQLRSQTETADLPIIMFSGKAQEEAVREGMKAGATHYLVKPASPTEIIALIKKYLERINMPVDSSTEQDAVGLGGD